MSRAWAIVERELRRFRRSPTLMAMSLIGPVLQLVVLGYAFGGNVKHLHVGVVDLDHKVPAVRIRELFGAVSANAKTFDTVEYADLGAALTDLRNGRLNGVLTIPPDYSRRLLAGDSPRVALVEDNTDNFVTGSLAASMGSIVGTMAQPAVIASRVSGQPTLDVVEMYPYVPYIQYLLPGTITISIFVMVMIGGGIIYIDDKARGLHEGYLVTPISRLELVAGFNLSGTIKAVLAGIVLMTIGSLIAGVPDPFAPLRLLRMLLVIVRDGVRPDQPDVPADGPRHRSARAARGLRHPEHAAVLSERRRVSAAGLSHVDAVARGGRSVHVRRARVQVPAAQEHGPRGHRVRSLLPGGVLGRDHDARDVAVPEVAVTARRLGGAGVGDQDTRARLVDAATRLFAEQGFKRVTVRAICRAAHANVAAINYHFRNKLGLYREVVERGIAVLQETTDLARKATATGTPEEQLAAYIDVVTERLVSASGHQWLHRFIAREMAEPTPVLSSFIDRGLRPRFEHLERIVADLLRLPPGHPRVVECAMSVLAQIMMFRSNPVTERMRARARTPAPTPQAIAAHIKMFSLAGIRAVQESVG